MRIAIALPLLLLIAAAPTSQPHQKSIHIKEDAPDSVRAYVEASIGYRKQRLSDLKQESEDIRQDISDMRNGRIDRNAVQTTRKPRPNGKGYNYTFNNADEKREAIVRRMGDYKQKEALIEQFSEPTFLPMPPCNADNLRPGFMGGFGLCKVEQVIDNRNMIITVTLSPPLTEEQIMAIARAGRDTPTSKFTIWVSDYPTANLIDSSQADLKGPWMAGTKQTGTGSMLQISPIPASQYIEIY
jgi:hypothetical protein